MDGVSCSPPTPSPQTGTPLPVSTPSHYVFGDVCTVRESIPTPIEKVFMESEGFGTKPHVRDRCRSNYEALTDPAKPPSGRDRPCVIMSPSVPVDGTEVNICMKTTMNKTPFKQLPLIVKFFGVAVAPNKIDDRERIHTDPEWPHPQQLLLAIPFTTNRPLKGLWPRGRENDLDETGKPQDLNQDTGRSTTTPLADDGVPVYKYDRDTMVWVVDKCDELLEKWAQNCMKDPNFSLAYEQDYRQSWCSVGRSSRRKVSRSTMSLPVLHEVVNVTTARGPKTYGSPSSKGIGRKKSKWSLRSRRSQRPLSQATGAAK